MAVSSAASFSRTSLGGGSATGDGDEDLTVLADAIKKMDGLIGDFRPAVPEPAEPVLTSDPAVQAVVEQCEQLAGSIGRLKQQSPLSSSSDGVHPRECVPPSIQEEIICWLGGLSLEESQQLIHDKDELLGQMVSLQQQLEAAKLECSRLTAKVASVEKRCVEREQRLRDLNEDLRVKKTSLATKEVELRHLQDQIQAGYQQGGKLVSFAGSTSHDAPPHRKSFRRALKKAFGRKDRHSATLKGAGVATQQRPVNPRAEAFIAKDSEALAEWFKSIGLDMYLDIVIEKALTGERLAEFVADDDCHQLVQVGILSTLHCKKLKLAIQDALKEEPSPLSLLDHEWVGHWLVDIGLPQFQRTFHDARFDGCMLNQVTLEDLKLLDVTTPFHIASIKRALQAFRMCGFDKDYLKDNCPAKHQGSQKLLHWSARDVGQWVCGIELDGYATALDKMGIHGAIMLLDVNFSSESLARALGINQTKTIIRKHLSKKFMELIGPVAAQNKVDALQTKTFVPLDPTEVPSGFSRNRSRSVGHRRRDKESSQQLLPMDQFPVAPLTHPVSPMSPVSAASSSDIQRYPTP